MLIQDRLNTEYTDTIMTILPKLKVLGFEDIKSELSEHPDPKPLSVSEESDLQFFPDIVADRKGRKAYIEIAQKTKHINQLISKWKLLAETAASKNGLFAIVLPKGTTKFTLELIESNDIAAKIIRI